MAPGAYREVVLDRFADPTKVHDLEHYVRAPDFHLRMFRSFLGRPDLGTRAERLAAQAAYETRYPVSTTSAFADLRDLAAGDDFDPRRLVAFLVRAYEVLS